MIRKNNIDLFKLLAALFIVCLHVKYGALDIQVVKVLRIISRWALPFFFITSGYFLAFKIENGFIPFSKIKNNIKNLLLIFVIASTIYTPLTIISGRDILSSLIYGGWFHLWFLTSLLFGYLIIYALSRIKLTQILPALSLLILLVFAFSQFNKVLDVKFIRMFISIPFLWIGMLIQSGYFNKIKLKTLCTLLVVAVLLQFVESYYLANVLSYNLYYLELSGGIILFASFLFMIVERLDLSSCKVSKYGTFYSLFIYLYHPLIYILIFKVIEITNPAIFNNVLVLSSIITFSCTLILAVILKHFTPRLFNFLNGK